MKYIITERQYSILKEQEQILELPGLDFFDNDWNWLQDILSKKGNPLYSLSGDVDLEGIDIKSLGNLTSVGGNLNLNNTQIESLGNLTSVGGNLMVGNTQIESLENLSSVGGCLLMWNTPVSEKYSESEIDNMINVGGGIFTDGLGFNDNGDYYLDVCNYKNENNDDDDW